MTLKIFNGKKNITSHQADSKEMDSFRDLIDTAILKEHYESKDDRKYDYYHPSELGKCLRKQQYNHYASTKRIKKECSPFPSQKYRLFDKGHNMHLRWQRYFGEIDNILMGRWQCTNPLCYLFDDHGKILNTDSISSLYEKNKSRIYPLDNYLSISLKPEKCICGNTHFDYRETPVFSEELKIKGNSDLVINCDHLNMDAFKDVLVKFDKRFLPQDGRKVVIDMKTIGSNAWKNQVLSRGVNKDYIIQLISYIHLLNCDYGIVIYENKDDSQLALFKIERNDNLWGVIKFQLEEMVKMRETGSLPYPKATSKIDNMCKDCDFRSLCHKSEIWKNPNLDQCRADFYKSTL